ncbi:DUF6029 family protein [Hymenobacter sediminicola]|uniref:DUF5723 domain-containing protein n=1 Tax=Hymenobacter sediminicola TaxID=2761579 RepID=A0A7G7W2W0_9BACT|nr:DUF6029 family protein [Hymenobacter sediminicola]QNH60703.1 hypothetical protein H4317_10905 [Hymenobacter sediminicola]
MKHFYLWPAVWAGTSLGLLLGHGAAAQGTGNALEGAQLHGDFQTDIQTYRPDSLIGAPEVPEKLRSNTFANLILTTGKFSAGVRYEAYLAPLQGFDPRYRGSGIPYRYATYDGGRLQVTVGNFYEQFGNGLIFRAYEERNLGIDNSIDGLRVRLQPVPGVRITGMIGRQRFFFDKSPAIVRGVDAEVTLNDLLPGLDSAATRITVGGSFLSKYQADEDPQLILPENVGAAAGRVSVNNGGFNFAAEYAQKANDPSVVNNFIYRPGRSLLVTTSYARNGIGLVLAAKRVDNMDFRADRAATGNAAVLNFLPALTKQHTYALAASIYPYATQPLGEMSGQAELTYHIPKSPLGGEYGTDVSVNFSAVNGIDRRMLNDDLTTRQGYESGFLKVGGAVYYRDFNVELHRRFTSKWKANAMYARFVYNKDVVENLGTGYGIVRSHIGVLDVTHKFTPRHSLRGELQGLFTQQDKGSWAMALLEYTYSPHWFLTVFDQYNYGNSHEEQRIHYLTGQVGYVGGTTRIAMGYGRQRAGIVCVGGVCRYVPASNGLAISITSSF